MTKLYIYPSNKRFDLFLMTKANKVCQFRSRQQARGRQEIGLILDFIKKCNSKLSGIDAMILIKINQETTSFRVVKSICSAIALYYDIKIKEIGLTSEKDLSKCIK